MPTVRSSSIAERTLLTPSGPKRLACRQMIGASSHNPSPVWSQTCICLVLAGNGGYRHAAPATPIALSSGDIFLHPRGVWHRVDRQQPEQWREWSLFIPPEIETALLQLGVWQLSPYCIPGTLAPRRAAFRRLHHSFKDSKTTDAQLITALINFLQTIRQAHGQSDPLDQAARDLADDLHGFIDLEQYARQLQLSPAHFRRQFNKRFGQSPRSYRESHRMQRAKALLCEEGLSVTATASELGYANAFTFSKQFKKFFKTAPSQCAKNDTG